MQRLTTNDGAAGPGLREVAAAIKLLDSMAPSYCSVPWEALERLRNADRLLRAALREPHPQEGEIESLEAAIVSLKEGADRIAKQGPDSLPILWRGKSIAYGVVLDCISNMRANRPASALRDPLEAQDGKKAYCKLHAFTGSEADANECPDCVKAGRSSLPEGQKEAK